MSERTQQHFDHLKIYELSFLFEQGEQGGMKNLMDGMFLVVDRICTGCVLDMVLVYILETAF